MKPPIPNHNLRPDPGIPRLPALALFGSTVAMVLLACTGCATGYLDGRFHDAADIFTATGGLGGGAKAQLGPVNLGLPLCVAEHEYGLRGGTLIASDMFSYDLWLLVLGTELFVLEKDDRDKSFVVATFNPDGPRLEGTPALFTQIELLAGLGLTVRLGFNPGELLDFLLGWTTLDLYGDDSPQPQKPIHKENEPGPNHDPGLNP